MPGAFDVLPGDLARACQFAGGLLLGVGRIDLRQLLGDEPAEQFFGVAANQECYVVLFFVRVRRYICGTIVYDRLLSVVCGCVTARW